MSGHVQWLEFGALFQIAFSVAMSTAIFVMWLRRKDAIAPKYLRVHVALLAVSYNVLLMYPLLHLAGCMPHDETQQGVMHFGVRAVAILVLAAMAGNLGLVAMLRRQLRLLLPCLRDADGIEA